MKHILTIFIFSLISCSTTSKISWDNTKTDNVRHIGTKGIETQIENATYNISLTVFSGQESKYYCLSISSLWRIENNGVVLLKLGNDESVRLVADNVIIGEVDWPSYSPIIGSTTSTGVINTKKVEYFSSIYLLQHDILKKIESYGVNKIRIQFGATYKERFWSKDKLGKYIKNNHELIEEQLKISVKKSKSIEDGF